MRGSLTSLSSSSLTSKLLSCTTSIIVIAGKRICLDCTNNLKKDTTSNKSILRCSSRSTTYNCNCQGKKLTDHFTLKYPGPSKMKETIQVLLKCQLLSLLKNSKRLVKLLVRLMLIPLLRKQF